MLGGIGYTVSLLIARLAFTDVAAQQRAGLAVLVGSSLAAVGAIVILRYRTRVHTPA
jgi:NhaA family Na+:H+ antiporter